MLGTRFVQHVERALQQPNGLLRILARELFRGLSGPLNPYVGDAAMELATVFMWQDNLTAAGGLALSWLAAVVPKGRRVVWTAVVRLVGAAAILLALTIAVDGTKTV